MFKSIFFYSICRTPNLYSNLRKLKVSLIEFNSQKFRILRYVFVEFLDYFGNDENNPYGPKMTQSDPENTKNSKNFPIFNVFKQFLSSFDRHRGLEC